MSKIGVVGAADKVMCFMAAGFSVYDAGDAKQAAAGLRRAKNDGCAVIFITPELAEDISGEIEKYTGAAVPAVIPLPEAGGGYGITQLRHAAERAVGADIIFNGK